MIRDVLSCAFKCDLTWTSFTLQVVQAGRRLYRPPGETLTIGQVVELTRDFIEAYQAHKNEPSVAALKNKVVRYNRHLRNLGLKDHQVERATSQNKFRNLMLLVYRANILLIWGALALPGTILHAPIFIPAKIYSKIKAKQALAASTVKVAAKDVIASWKVLFCLGATPVLYTVYAALATWAAWRQGCSPQTVRAMPFVVFCGLPFLAVSALKFGEAEMDVFKSLPPLFLSLLPGSQRELNNIKKERARLAQELTDMVERLKPKRKPMESAHSSALEDGPEDNATALKRRKVYGNGRLPSFSDHVSDGGN